MSKRNGPDGRGCHVDFRLLGPLEVRAEGRAVTLRGPRLSAVLATLLLYRNDTVTVAQLGQAAWLRPPRAVASNVRTYVAQLRALFVWAGETGPRLFTDPAGYRLVVGRDELDLAVFEELVEEGEAALARSEPALAMQHLGNAVDLWRGEPLTGLPAGPLLQAEAARLDECLLSTVERWADAGLAAGRPQPVAVELTRRIRTRPLREQMWARLMLALYRCGRRADALSAYQDAYRTFREDLGIAPGGALQRLHQQILNADPALDPEPSPSVTAGPSDSRPLSQGPSVSPGPSAREGAAPIPRPRQLPANVTGFSGRERQLRELDALLPAGRREPVAQVCITAIVGTPGVGKTALAVYWGHQRADRFPDGQLYVNLHGFSQTAPVRPGDAVAGFLRALGVRPDRVPAAPDEAAALYRSLLAGRRMLVLLDNAVSAEQVRPLLPGSATCAVVITSRDGLAGLRTREGASHIDLGTLDPDEATALLEGVVGTDRLRAEPEAAAELVRLCAGLPLALRITAAKLTRHPGRGIRAYLTQLSADRLATLRALGDPGTAVRAAFDLSYRRFAIRPRRLFRLLGLLDGPDVEPSTAARLLGATESEALSALATLTRAHLVEHYRPGRYRMHDLLRVFARERSGSEDSDGDRTEARLRVLEWYLRLTRDAHETVYGEPPAGGRPSAAVERAVAWFGTERPNLLAAAEQPMTLPAGRDLAARLIVAMYNLARGDGHAAAWNGVATRALAAARAAGDPRLVADLQDKRCHFLVDARDYAAAAECQAEAVALYHSLGDRPVEARARMNLAVVRHLLGQPRQAATAYATALRAARAAGDRKLEAFARLNLSAVYRADARYARAIEHARAGCDILHGLGDWHGEASALDELAAVHRDGGDLSSAVAALRIAIALVRERDGVLEGRMLRELGEGLLADGRPDEARDALRRAVDLLVRIGSPDAEPARRALAAATPAGPNVG